MLVSLHCSFQTPKADRPPEKQESGTNLEQTADLQNDFFSVQFLAPFPVAGLYQLNLEARLIDPEGQRLVTLLFARLKDPLESIKLVSFQKI